MPKKGDALTPMNDEDRIPSYKKKYNIKETSGARKENMN